MNILLYHETMDLRNKLAFMTEVPKNQLRNLLVLNQDVLQVHHLTH
jgi:hypothetical protein